MQTPMRSSSKLGRNKRASPFPDSPSKQLLFELERSLEQVTIHEVELRKVHAYKRQSFYEQLDERDQQRAFEQYAALDAATARHDQIRHEAERTLQEYHRQEEEARKAREAAERAEKEKQERERLERERKAKEEAERKAAEERAKVEQAKREAEVKERQRLEAEEKGRRERQATEEAAAKEKADKDAAEKKAKEAAQQALENQKQKEQQDLQQKTAQQNAQRQSTGTEAEHNRYLQIHQTLKQFRKSFWEECKKVPELKKTIGQMRRDIRKCVGQLTGEKGANKQPSDGIRKILLDCRDLREAPSLDVRDYIAFPPPSLQALPAAPAPSSLIYMFNIFSKAVISQWGGEAGAASRTAEPVGVLAATIFSQPEYQFPHPNDDGTTHISLIDILLAKFHHSCPVLWGIYGPEATARGRLRIGWRRQGEDKAFVSEQAHAERMSGLGAGFASISLRNFAKSRMQNPYPPRNYWTALAHLTNTPPNEMQPTHFLVLKGLLETSTERFVQFFDGAAIVALRRAVVGFPNSAPEPLRSNPACRAVMVLGESLKKDKGLIL